MRQFAISDIHGCANTFKKLLKQIDFGKKDELYLLGDYIDRGPDSKGVIDHIWHLQKSGHRVYCLKGNHEEMMVRSIRSWQERNRWLRHGGKEAIASFGVESVVDVPQQYIYWMENLPYFFEVQNYLLVHAGFNFNSFHPLRQTKDMIWIRNWYQTINRDWLKDRVIVHGHTPIPKTEIEKMVLNLEVLPVLDIDGGCTFVEDEFGWLCALELGTRTLYFEKRRGAG